MEAEGLRADMFLSKDPLDYFNKRDYELSKWEESLPKCDSCGQPIQDNPYHEIPFCGMLFKICDECLHSYLKWQN